MKISFGQITALASVTIFMIGVGYSAGRVHANLDTHEKAEGHAPTVKKLYEHDVQLARITLVVELLEKRLP